MQLNKCGTIKLHGENNISYARLSFQISRRESVNWIVKNRGSIVMVQNQNWLN